MLAAGATGGVIGHAAAQDAAPTTGSGPDDAVPFTGRHQAGIVTPAQDRLHFVAFDVTTDSRDELVAMLKAWTVAARRMTAGRDAGPVGAVDGEQFAPPDDTGEAIGLPAVGADADHRVRAHPVHRPPTAPTGSAWPPAVPRRWWNCRPSPATRSSPPAAAVTCASRPAPTIRRSPCTPSATWSVSGVGVVSVRWSQLGFGRTSSTSTGQATPRNLFGFKDGTNNLKAENDGALDRFVWVGDGDSGADWLAGGSYLVARRIRMLIEPWDTSTLDEQEKTIGRAKGVGAPLGQRAEFDPVDVTKQADGAPAVPPTSHVFLANPHNAKTAILRRGYSFVDGSDGLGRLDAGLFFIAYQRDPETGFVQVQRNLRTDAMNEYIRHTSSAVFACPPGLRDDGDWWGRTLFEG